MGRQKLDLEGQRFGKLTVIREEAPGNRGCTMWLCQCQCGRTRIVRGSNLTCGDTKSCGCEKGQGRGKERPLHRVEPRGTSVHYVHSPLCPICGLSRGGRNVGMHKKCSKILQQRGLHDGKTAHP